MRLVRMTLHPWRNDTQKHDDQKPVVASVSSARFSSSDFRLSLRNVNKRRVAVRIERAEIPRIMYRACIFTIVCSFRMVTDLLQSIKLTRRIAPASEKSIRDLNESSLSLSVRRTSHSSNDERSRPIPCESYGCVGDGESEGSVRGVSHFLPRDTPEVFPDHGSRLTRTISTSNGYTPPFETAASDVAI